MDRWNGVGNMARKPFGSQRAIQVGKGKVDDGGIANGDVEEIASSWVQEIGYERGCQIGLEDNAIQMDIAAVVEDGEWRVGQIVCPTVIIRGGGTRVWVGQG